MWSFSSNHLSNNAEDASDDEASSIASEEEGLECPICWESFNIVENMPYVLWCGHTLCKNCVLALQWAVVKFPTLPIQLPLLISCPWCNLLCPRVIYRGNLKFPSKNYFLLWMVESKSGDRHKRNSGSLNDHKWTVETAINYGNTRGEITEILRGRHESGNENMGVGRFHTSLRKSLAFFCHLTAKFPLIVVLLLIILYAIPASAAVLALYILITILFAVPSFLVLYFAYPSLDWLVREIVT